MRMVWLAFVSLPHSTVNLYDTTAKQFSPRADLKSADFDAGLLPFLRRRCRVAVSDALVYLALYFFGNPRHPCKLRAIPS
jgi:hypothetical protein